jgi:transcriptional regulator with XRE-family HTH domain
MKKMKQKDLANLMGKSEAEISKWLKGTHNFNIDTILKIQTILDEDIIQVVKTPKLVEVKNWTDRLTIVVSGKDTSTSNSNNIEEAASNN